MPRNRNDGFSDPINPSDVVLPWGNPIHRTEEPATRTGRTSALQAGGVHAAKSAGAALTGGVAGEELGGWVGTGLGTAAAGAAEFFTGGLATPAVPWIIGGGNLLGRVIGGYKGYQKAAEVEDQYLDNHQDVARSLGMSREQMQAYQEEHPTASFVGDLAGGFAGGKPSLKGLRRITDDTSAATAGAIRAARGRMAGGAGLGAGMEVYNEASNGEDLNPYKIAGVAATGALMGGGENRIGRTARAPYEFVNARVDRGLASSVNLLDSTSGTAKYLDTRVQAREAAAAAGGRSRRTSNADVDPNDISNLSDEVPDSFYGAEPQSGPLRAPVLRGDFDGGLVNTSVPEGGAAQYGLGGAELANARNPYDAAGSPQIDRIAAQVRRSMAQAEQPGVGTTPEGNLTVKPQEAPTDFRSSSLTRGSPLNNVRSEPAAPPATNIGAEPGAGALGGARLERAPEPTPVAEGPAPVSFEPKEALGTTVDQVRNQVVGDNKLMLADPTVRRFNIAAAEAIRSGDKDALRNAFDDLEQSHQASKFSGDKWAQLGNVVENARQLKDDYVAAHGDEHVGAAGEVRSGILDKTLTDGAGLKPKEIERLYQTNLGEAGLTRRVSESERQRIVDATKPQKTAKEPAIPAKAEVTAPAKKAPAPKEGAKPPVASEAPAPAPEPAPTPAPAEQNGYKGKKTQYSVTYSEEEASKPGNVGVLVRKKEPGATSWTEVGRTEFEKGTHTSNYVRVAKTQARKILTDAGEPYLEHNLSINNKAESPEALLPKNALNKGTAEAETPAPAPAPAPEAQKPRVKPPTAAEPTPEPKQAAPEETIHDVLTKGEKGILAEHYGESEYNAEARRQFERDVQYYKDGKKVNPAIRDIVEESVKEFDPDFEPPKPPKGPAPKKTKSAELKEKTATKNAETRSRVKKETRSAAKEGDQPKGSQRERQGTGEERSAPEASRGDSPERGAAEQPKEEVAPEPKEVEPTPKVTAEHVEQAAVHDQLTPEDQTTLAEHYGESEYNDVAKRKFVDDVVRAINEGLSSVNKAIRQIVKRVQAGVMSVALVFHPAPLVHPDMPYKAVEARAVVTAEVPTKGAERMSPLAREVYAKVAPIAEGNGKGFFIADKPNGTLHVFAADGSYITSSAALYGAAKGDVLAAERLAKPPSELTAAEKITPAGSYKLRLASNAEYTGGHVLFLSDAKTGQNMGGVAIHAVYTGIKSENRIARLESGTAADNKVSFGCINTTNETFLREVLPRSEQFDGGMVFVLPDNVAATGEMFKPLERKLPPEVPLAPEKGETDNSAVLPSRQSTGNEKPTKPDSLPEERRNRYRERNRGARDGGEGNVSKDELDAHVEKLTRGWALEKPTVVDSIDQLPAELREAVKKDGAEDAYGFVGKDGKVYLLSHNLPNLETGTAALYHEALGHIGLSRLLRERLDGVLRNMVASNKSLRDDVRAWLKDNPKRYTGKDRFVRAAEEVLARRSEKGTIEASLLSKIGAVFKELGRKTGMKLKYTDREIQAILSMAHDQVVNGARESVAMKGLRYMYAGENARVADYGALNQAKLAEAAGQPRDETIKRTGWFKAKDGKWRFWIDDRLSHWTSRVADIPENQRIRLADVFEHGALYTAYPQLRDIALVRTDEGGPGHASWSAGGRVVSLDYRTPERQAREDLIHELQHAVQTIEGFAKGGSPNWTPNAHPVEMTNALRSQYARKSSASTTNIIKAARLLSEKLDFEVNPRELTGDAFKELKAELSPEDRLNNAQMLTMAGLDLKDREQYATRGALLRTAVEDAGGEKVLSDAYDAEPRHKAEFERLNAEWNQRLKQLDAEHEAKNTPRIAEVEARMDEITKERRAISAQKDELGRQMDAMEEAGLPDPDKFEAAHDELMGLNDKLSTMREESKALNDELDKLVTPDHSDEYYAKWEPKITAAQKAQWEAKKVLQGFQQKMHTARAAAPEIGWDTYVQLHGEMEARDAAQRLTSDPQHDLEDGEFVPYEMDPRGAGLGPEGEQVISNQSEQSFSKDNKYMRPTERDVERNTEKMPAPVREASVRNANVLLRKGERITNTAAHTFKIVEWADRLGMPSAREWRIAWMSRNAEAAQTTADLGKWAEKFDALPDEYRGVGPGTLNGVAQDMRFSGLWAFKPEHLRDIEGRPIKAKTASEMVAEGYVPKTAAEKADLAMGLRAEQAFKQLPKEAQDVVKEAYKVGHESFHKVWNSRIDFTNGQFDAKIRDVEEAMTSAKSAGDAEQVKKLTDKKLQLEKNRKSAIASYKAIMRADLSSPYLPVRRYGDYVVVGRSPEYIAAEKLAKETGDESRLREMEHPSQKHFFTAFVDSEFKAAKMRDEIAKEYGSADYFTRGQGTHELLGGRDTIYAMQKVKALLEGQNMDTESRESLEGMVGDMMMTMLAQNSARQAEARFRKIDGGNIDMFRGFKDQVQADAHMIGALFNNDKILSSLMKLKQEAKEPVGGSPSDRAQREALLQEINARHTMSMAPPPVDKAISMATQATSYWMLMRPRFLLQQILQNPVITWAKLAARHGHGESGGALIVGLRKAIAASDGTGMTGALDISKLSPEDRAYAQFWQSRGLLDIGVNKTLRQWNSEVSGDKATAWRKVAQHVNNFSRKAEEYNRFTAAYAAAELALKSKSIPRLFREGEYMTYLQDFKRTNRDPEVKPLSAKKYAAAVYAENIVNTTHGAYDSFNAPRPMRTNTGRLALQFRNFQLMQLEEYGQALKDGWRSPDLSPQEQAVARRTFAYMLGHAVVIAGGLGAPGVSKLIDIYNWLTSDDEHRGDAERDIREALGEGETTELLLHGLPALAGVNLTDTVGQSTILSLQPYNDLPKDADSYNKYITGLMGPAVGGIGINAARGIDQIGKGYTYKGLEMMMPGLISDAMKAYRLANEGETDANGDVTEKSISPIETGASALGLKSLDTTKRQFNRNQSYENKEFLKDKEDDLHRRFNEARAAGDTATMQSLRDRWLRLQQSAKEMGVRPKPLASLMQSYRAKLKREKNTRGGVQFTNATRQEVEDITDLTGTGDEE